MPADGDGATFGDEHRAEEHTALGADGHVAADGGGGGDVGGRVNVLLVPQLEALDVPLEPKGGRADAFHDQLVGADDLLAGVALFNRLHLGLMG